jgi:hypothetical protein
MNDPSSARNSNGSRLVRPRGLAALSFTTGPMFAGPLDWQVLRIIVAHPLKVSPF